MSHSTHRLNRRQLKKKHLGEFQELGFLVSAQLAQAKTSEAERNSFMYRFIDEAIEANGLAFGGGSNDEFSGIVVSAKAYGKVEERHRELVRAWLGNQGNLEKIEIGELRDAWYGWG